MASRRGRGRGAPTRPRDQRDQYTAESTTSDREYRDDARYRMRMDAQRRWIIRIGVLAAIALAIWIWGKDALDRVLFRSRTSQYELQKAEQGVQDANDRRTGGANFNENP